jgi:hypothetical protein
MNAQALLALLRKKPFQPLRVVLSSGQSYVISHPEAAFIDRFTLYLGVPGPRGLDAPFQEVVTISMLHVTSAEPINGRVSGRKKPA